MVQYTDWMDVLPERTAAGAGLLTGLLLSPNGLRGLRRQVANPRFTLSTRMERSAQTNSKMTGLGALCSLVACQGTEGETRHVQTGQGGLWGGAPGNRLMWHAWVPLSSEGKR